MSDRPRQSWMTVCGAIIALQPLLYISAFGPACRLAHANKDCVLTVSRLYAPLFVPVMPYQFTNFLLAYGRACSDDVTAEKIRMAARILQNDDLNVGHN